MDAAAVQMVLDEVFDQAIVHHGFVDYMRDYEIVLHCTADPRTGIAPEHVRLLFKECVAADVDSAVPPEVWRRSRDERLISYEPGIEDLGGYVWGVKWQVMYPGAKVVSPSPRAEMWSRELASTFHEVRIETNGHNISLVFGELISSTVQPGYTPFTVGDGGPDFKIPL